MVQPDFSTAQTVTTTPPWNCATPVPGPPMGPAGGMLAGTYPNPTVVPGVVSPGGTAGGDLNGTYPNPLVDGINGAPVGTTTPLARGDLLVANATPALTRLPLGAATMQLQSNGTDCLWGYPLAGPPSGPAGGTLAGTYPNPTIAASGVGAGNYGGPTQIPMLSVAVDGRITTATQAAISLSGITASGDLQGTYPSPSLMPAAKSKWTETAGTLTPVNATDLVSLSSTSPNYDVLVWSSSSAFYKSRLGGFGLPVWRANQNGAGTPDYPSAAAWQIALDCIGDVFAVSRAPAGATGSFADRLKVDSAGNLTIGPGPGGAASSPGIRITGTGAGLRCQGTGTALGDNYSNAIAFGFTSPNVTCRVDSTNQGTVNITPPSDERLKRDIREDDVPGLTTIMALRPVTFEYRQEMRESGFAVGRRCGLIAQEAQEHVPFCIEEDGSDEHYLTLDYRALVPVLIKAVQDVSMRLDALEGRIHA